MLSLSIRERAQVSTDSGEVDQFQTPCFTRDTVTQKPLQGLLGRHSVGTLVS